MTIPLSTAPKSLPSERKFEAAPPIRRRPLGPDSPQVRRFRSESLRRIRSESAQRIAHGIGMVVLINQAMVRKMELMKVRGSEGAKPPSPPPAQRVKVIRRP